MAVKWSNLAASWVYERDDGTECPLWITRDDTSAVDDVAREALMELWMREREQPDHVLVLDAGGEQDIEATWCEINKCVVLNALPMYGPSECLWPKELECLPN